MIMSDWMDDLAAGQGRLEEIEGGMEGNLGKWADGHTTRRVAERHQQQQEGTWAGQPVRSGVHVAPILIFAVIVIVALVIFAH
jgi:hypothetical protein